MLSPSGSRGTSRAATVCVLIFSRYVIGAPLLCVLMSDSDAHVKIRKFFIGIGDQTGATQLTKHKKLHVPLCSVSHMLEISHRGVRSKHSCRRCDLVSIAQVGVIAQGCALETQNQKM